MAKNQHSRGNEQLVCWVNAFSERHPRFYLYSAVFFMLLGYVFFLLFPYLIVESATALFREIPIARTAGQWVAVGGWSAILLSCLFLSGQIFRLHFSRVSGLKLSKGLAPDLYRLIAGVREYTAHPSIRDVVLSDQYELRIEETPCFGYPFMTTNTLVIGMPMLQTLSADEFRCEVMRRFGQYSRGRFQPHHWLFRSRLLWRRYLDALDEHKRYSELPLRWFFSVYSPLFEKLTLPAARMDELAGDTAVLEWLNDRDYFEALKSRTIAGYFLRECYWRKVYQSALKNPKVTLKPFEKLEHVSGNFGSQDLRRKWLYNAFIAEQSPFMAAPVFKLRMENIGQSSLRDAPVVAEKTAAMTCLGAARKDLVPIMDKHWYSTTFSKWTADYDRRSADLKMVRQLSRKSRQQFLSIKEVLLYARLAKQMRGDPIRESIAKLCKRNMETLLPSVPFWNVFHRKVKSIQGDDI